MARACHGPSGDVCARNAAYIVTSRHRAIIDSVRWVT